jgi:hypothetical protein
VIKGQETALGVQWPSLFRAAMHDFDGTYARIKVDHGTRPARKWLLATRAECALSDGDTDGHVRRETEADRLALWQPAR